MPHPLARRHTGDAEMLPATADAFDYRAIPPGVADECRRRATAIRELCQNVADQVIRIGGHLAAVRDLLHGGFHSWIEFEFALGRSTVYKMINTWERFHGRDVSKFDHTALYVLAAPSVPDVCRELAFLIAERGERITPALAREIVEAKKAPTLTEKEVRRYHKENPEDKDPDDPGANLTRDNRLIVATLRALATDCTMIVIQRVTDTDAEDEKIKSAAPPEGKSGKGRAEESSLATPILITVYRDNRPAETFGSAESLEIAILRAGGVRPMQRCSRCNEEKELLVHFSKKANKGIGRCLRCKKCEAERVKEAKRKGNKIRRGRQSRRQVVDEPAECHPAASPTAPKSRPSKSAPACTA